MKLRFALLLSLLSMTRAAAQGAPSRPTPGELVRYYTLAYDSQRERAWRDSVDRVVRPDAPTRALLDGTLARLSFRFGDAERAYRQVLSNPTHAAVVPARVGLAAVRAARGEYLAARASLDSVVVAALRANDSTVAAEQQLSIALLTVRTGTLDSARARFTHARQLASARDAVLQARLACTDIQFSSRAGGRISDTLWTRILAQAVRVGPRIEADCRFIYAQHLNTTGGTALAAQMFDTLATLQEQLRLWNGLSATRQWQGFELTQRGFYAAAIKRLQQATALADRSGSLNGKAWALMDLARVTSFAGAAGDAAEQLRTARQIFIETGDRSGRLSADNALAESALRNRDLAGADSIFTRLTGDFRSIMPQWVAGSLLARAWIAGVNDSARAGRLLDSLDRVIRERNQRGYATEMQYQRALLAIRHGHPALALPKLDSLAALRLFGPSRVEILERRAEAHAMLGALDSAVAGFGLAMRTLEAWRNGQPRRELALATLQDRAMDWDKDLDMATLIARVAAAGRTHDALAMAEARRVRGVEQAALQRAGLGLDLSRSSKPGDAPRSAPVVVRAQESAALDPGRLPALASGRLAATDAVLSYVVGDGFEPTTAFVITRSGVKSVRLAPLDSVRAVIETFNGMLASGQQSAPLADVIASAMVRPALAMLSPGVSRLTIVADGELHRLPFAALTITRGEYLVDRYAIAFALSVEDALGGVRRAARAPGQRVLAVGAPSRMPTVDGHQLSALPGANREAQGVADRFADSEVLRGERATRDIVLDRAERGGTLLHVATHAIADQHSFVRTAMALQPTTSHNGLLHNGDFERRLIPFDLVVLSACASGDGVLLAGQGVHGFVGAMLDAGAGGVIATRWPVSDAAIVPWMSRFYDELTKDGDPVRAVQATQRAAIAAGASPAIWSTLHYVGDPGLRVSLTARQPSAWRRFTGSVRRWLHLD